jgi:predicted nucleic acid-binding protein
MKSVLVDTLAWLALINKSDLRHKKAKKIRDRLFESHCNLLITDYILVETANALSRIPFRKAAIQLISFIQSSENIQLIEIDKSLFLKAWDLYSARLDKEWSLTDCANFIVMNAMGISEAFTSDHHFEQAGFRILIKE